MQDGQTEERVPVSPALEDLLGAVRAPVSEPVLSARVIYIAALSIGIGFGAGVAATILTSLIGLITNVAFYHRFSLTLVSPAGANAGAWLLIIPVVGGVLVGLLARYGSASIRGHGIPEVMENVIQSGSRIPARLLFLKPISAAIAIGTGGPFGAEGPIIATGGALGSLVGQWIRVTADERKTLLAAGAAAGMAATFGSPVAGVLLAVELLLFEYRARSIIPVALATSIATAIRMLIHGSAPAFSVPALANPSMTALLLYTALGAFIGFAAVFISRATYWIEDMFERLPVHWMWWPALGAVAVGVIGLIEPRTLGIGYEHIVEIASGGIVGTALIAFIVLKFLSWAIYLGSGTSGGTLAPLFMIGGGMGASIGALLIRITPSAGINVTAAAIVGMAAIFAGASHALLASIVFAFETTRQPMGLLPLLAGCSAAYLVSLLLSPHSIMTEKLARRGRVIRNDYSVDYLSQITAGEIGIKEVTCVHGADTVEQVRAWFAAGDQASTHQGFPVVNDDDHLMGVVTRRDILAQTDPKIRMADLVHRPPAITFADNTLREAADHMVRQGVGRLPVVMRDEPTRVVGIISRSDLLAAHHSRLAASSEMQEGIASRIRVRFPTF